MSVKLYRDLLKTRGFVKIVDFFSDSEKSVLLKYFDEIENLKEKKNKHMIYYENNNKKSRIEYFYKYHSGVRNLINITLNPFLNKVPTKYTVAVGSDLFHEAIRTIFIKDVFKVMNKTTWHQFEIVTKRAERMEYLSSKQLKWPDNTTAGVAVEESKYKWRIDCLRNIKTKRLVSFVPIIGPIGKLDLSGIDSVGVVAEHCGPNPHEAKKEWIEEVNIQCKEQGIF